jgi:hypothetical protein
MANTRSATFSVRLKPEIKRRLARLAKVSGRSSNFLISDAVESYVADQERIAAGSSPGVPIGNCLLPAASLTTTMRLCAGRNCLVAPGAYPPARDSCLRCQRQTRGGGETGHSDCHGGGSAGKSSPSGACGGGTRNPRVGHWRPPYIVVYSVRKSQVTISTIWHGAQSRKKSRRGGRKSEGLD